MNVRRSSGEIVNATLLETFLALTFLIFGLALFESQRADDAEAASRRAPSPQTVDSLRARLDSVERMEHAKTDSLRRTLAANDSLRGVLLSKYPPDCEPAAWLTVTFQGAEQIHVVVHRTQFGFTAGTAFDVTPAAFAGRFSAVRAASEARRCRYLVRVEDTRGTSKQEYKRALSAVQSVFRPRNYLR